MTFAHHCVHTIPNSFLFVVSFLISWTPYAIVVFISTFISPTIISPIAGTLPGKFLTNKMYWLRQKWSFSLVLAIFAKSSICIVPSVYLMTSHDARPKCLQQRRKIKKPLSRAIWFRKLWIFFINQEIVMIEIEIRNQKYLQHSRSNRKYAKITEFYTCQDILDLRRWSIMTSVAERYIFLILSKISQNVVTYQLFSWKLFSISECMKSSLDWASKIIKLNDVETWLFFFFVLLYFWCPRKSWSTRFIFKATLESLKCLKCMRR